MKTVINAKIIFETDKYHSLYFDGNIEHKFLTMGKMADILRSGEYSISEVLMNDLMRDMELTLVIKHEEKNEDKKRN